MVIFLNINITPRPAMGGGLAAGLIFLLNIYSSNSLANFYKLETFLSINNLDDFFSRLNNLGFLHFTLAILYIFTLSISIYRLGKKKKSFSFIEKLLFIFSKNFLLNILKYLKENFFNLFFCLIIIFLLRILLFSSLDLNYLSIYDISFLVICVQPLICITLYSIGRFKGKNNIFLFESISLEKISVIIFTVFILNNYAYPKLYPILIGILSFLSHISLLDLIKCISNMLNHIPVVNKLNLEVLTEKKLNRKIFIFRYHKVNFSIYAYKIKSINLFNTNNNKFIDFNTYKVKGIAQKIFETTLFNRNRLYLIPKSKSCFDLIFKNRYNFCWTIRLTLTKDSIDLINNISYRFNLENILIKSNNKLNKILSEKPSKDFEYLNTFDQLERFLNKEPKDHKSKLLEFTDPKISNNKDIIVYTSRFDAQTDMSALSNVDPSLAPFLNGSRLMIMNDWRDLDPLDKQNLLTINDAADSLWAAYHRAPSRQPITIHSPGFLHEDLNQPGYRGDPQNIIYPSPVIRSALHRVLNALMCNVPVRSYLEEDVTHLSLSNLLNSSTCYCDAPTFIRIHEILRKIIFSEHEFANRIRRESLVIRWGEIPYSENSPFVRILTRP